jgi:hypothetical protein
MAAHGMNIRVLIFTLTMCQPIMAQAPIEEFIESFDGNGEYSTTDGRYSGLDNPGWRITGNGDGQLRDGGFAVDFETGAVDALAQALAKRLLGRGSFVERIEFKDIYMSRRHPMLESERSISLIHSLHFNDPLQRDNRILLVVNALDTFDPEPDEWGLFLNVGGFRSGDFVPLGSHVAVEIRYDDVLSQASVLFDHDLDDEDPGRLFGPFNYAGSFVDSHRTELLIHTGPEGVLQATIDSWSLKWVPGAGLGDFNGNGVLDGEDVDILSKEIRSGQNVLEFDLNSDETVDNADRDLWVLRLRNTYYGDSNLDGEFSSRDLVEIFQSGGYEDELAGNSTWATGDWNGDADFTSRDLVLAFQTGGYEKGPRDAMGVPEPSLAPFVLAWVTIVLSLIGRQRFLLR